jgi:hypothetical protein
MNPNYEYQVLFKYWVISNLPLVSDIKNIIHQNPLWYRKEFKIPKLEQFTSNTFINEYDIVFEKVPINKSEFIKNLDGGLVHTHNDREVLLKLKSNLISEVTFFYESDKYHYYNIHFEKSNIKTVMMVKDCEFKVFKNLQHTYVLARDPYLRAK